MFSRKTWRLSFMYIRLWICIYIHIYTYEETLCNSKRQLAVNCMSVLYIESRMMFIYENIRICTYCMHTRRVYIYIYVYTCVYIYIHKYIYTCIYMYMYIFTYCMHTRWLDIHMFIYEDIHTYIVCAHELTPYIYEHQVYATIYVEATRYEATAHIHVCIWGYTHIYSVCIRGDSIYIYMNITSIRLCT